MKEVEVEIRVNRYGANYSMGISIEVDDELADILDVIENGKRNSKISIAEDGAVYYRKAGFMSKDSGFNVVNTKTREYGQNIGLFYSGIKKGDTYLDLHFEENGEYTFEGVKKIA